VIRHETVWQEAVARHINSANERILLQTVFTGGPTLFSHVAHMPDNVPAKAVLCMACYVWDGVPPFPNWRRPRGHPPITWLHQIVQTVVCSLDTPLTAPRIGPCGERMLRPPRPRDDDDDDDDNIYNIVTVCSSHKWNRTGSGTVIWPWSNRTESGTWYACIRIAIC